MTQSESESLTSEDAVFLLGHYVEHRSMWEAANIFHQLDKARRMPLLSDRVEMLDPNYTVIHVITPEDKNKLVEGVGVQRFYHEGHYLIPERILLNHAEDDSYEAWLSFYMSDDRLFPLCEKLQAGMIERKNAGTPSGVRVLKPQYEMFVEVPVEPKSVHALYYSALEELNRVIDERKAASRVTT